MQSQRKHPEHARDATARSLAAMAISVNRLSAAMLRQQLALVPYLNSITADRIVDLRPFGDAANMRRRVNADAANARQCVSDKMAKHFNFEPADASDRAAAQPPRTWNAEYARELLALHVRVPWSAWDGYDDNSGHEVGMVWDYNADARRFTIRFSPHADCTDIGMSWDELKGTVPCLSSATEYAQLDETPNDPPVDFTTQPRYHRPRDAVWDQRKGAWVDCNGHDHDPSKSACSNHPCSRSACSCLFLPACSLHTVTTMTLWTEAQAVRGAFCTCFLSVCEHVTACGEGSGVVA